ncbi:MAG TPA: VWA domain-containing protein [Terriglobia bacterium]|nr:VWA domain-containing protein [Terriglobia bacterium]
MLFSSTLLRAARIGSFALAGLASATLFISPARAQDGVTGGRPVYSTPKPKNPSSAPDAAPDKQEKVIRVPSNLVTTPVAVIDKSGQFVYDLGENDFEILDNGIQQKIQSFDTEMRPLALVIVIETNEKTKALLDQVHPLASMFSSLLVGTRGEVAVIFYNDRVQVGQDFSNDSDKLSATFRDFTARSDGARLNDALWRAVSMLESRPKAERRVIVAFSDGYDSGSQTGKQEIVRRATSAEVAIYGLGFSPSKELLKKNPELPGPTPADNNVALPTPPNTVHDPTNSTNEYQTPAPVIPIMVASGEIIRSALAKSSLEFYAGYTGGVFYSHWSDKKLQDQLNRIASEIQSQYELAYVPDTSGEAGFHRIEVRVRRHGVRVRARAGYFSPGKTP